MTESLTAVRPEVVDFVAAVRARLTDLSEDEREELVGGLEADLTELVDDRGVDALGDPAAYAAELRAAAGLAPGAAKVRVPLGVRLDAGGALWARLVDRDKARPVWDFLVALRPVWWVVRGWIAVELLDLFWGGRPYNVLPSITDGVALGVPLLVAAVILSVLIGRADVRRTPLRLAVLAGNLLAVGMLPYVLDTVEFRASDDGGPAYAYGWQEGYNQAYQETDRQRGVVPDASEGLAFNGRPVINVFPYDARGNLLSGVQLFNENGEPLALNKLMATEERQTITYPWLRSGAGVWNVFPMPVGPWVDAPDKGFRDDSAWFGTTPPTLPASPVTEVRPVSLPKSAR